MGRGQMSASSASITDRRPHQRRRAIAAGIVGVSLLVSACGGSSALSHSQLSARAAADCRRANQAAAKLSAPVQSFSSVNAYARGLTPIVHTLIGDLTTLKPATADRAALQGYVGALRTGDQGLQLLAGASSPAQVTQARTLLASQSLPTRASALGAAACGAAP